MFGRKKEVEPENPNKMQLEISGGNQDYAPPEPVAQLDEKVVKLLTGNGNPERMANLDSGQCSMIEKLSVKNICIYNDSKKARQVIETMLNLSVSKNALLLHQVVQTQKPNIIENKQNQF